MKQFLTIILLLIVTFSYGQKKKMLNNENYDNKFLHLGFTLAVNQMNYKIERSSYLLTDSDTIWGMEDEPQLGFGLGLIADLRLAEYLSIRFEPGLQLGTRKIVYQTQTTTDSIQFDIENKEMPMPTIYVDFPVLFKLKAKRINNYRPYIIFGGSVKYDYEARKENQESEEEPIRVNPLQYFGELGFGIDYYMPFFKFSTEIKLCQGINNVLVDDPIERAQTIDRLLTRMVVVSLHFE